MKHIEAFCVWVFGLGFLGLGAAVATETIMRKVFNRSLQGVDELGGYVLAVGAALAIAAAVISRGHIRIDIVHEHLPRPLRIFLNLIALPSLTACAIALLVMAWYALGESISFGSTAQTPWATPLKIPQAIWFGALAIFAAVCLIETSKLFAALLGGRFDHIDRMYGPRTSKEELEDELADLKARGGLDLQGPGESKHP